MKKDEFTAAAPLVVHSHLCWNWVWQRPQQFLSRLSARHPTLFVEGPDLLDGDFAPYYEIERASDAPDVRVMRQYFPAERFDDGAWVDARRFDLLREALRELGPGFEAPVQWFYDPMCAPIFLGKLGERAVVYDCMDQLSQFRFAPPALLEREALLLAKADVVFAGGRKMWEDKSRFNANCHFYGCGVDIEHFGAARIPGPTPPELAALEGPILGFFGVVDERMDYDLVARLARERADWHVVIVGPACKIAPEALPQSANLHWLGGQPYERLPEFLRAFDIALMPFALNDATEYINPTKALEYMAGARPVISTAVPDVVSNFSGAALVARDADEFVAMCRAALESPDHQAIERGLEMARDNTWDAIVSALESHLERALAARAAKNIKPIVHPVAARAVASSPKTSLAAQREIAATRPVSTGATRGADSGAPVTTLADVSR